MRLTSFVFLSDAANTFITSALNVLISQPWSDRHGG
jgi:hypothetical protein